MWNVLYPNWKNFNFYFFDPQGKEILQSLSKEDFIYQKVKRASSHFVFLIKLSEEKKFWLKSFVPRLFKKNRVKHYLKILSLLIKLDIPVIKPIFLFWKNPQIAFLKREPFYGGILFPYIEEGFLKKEKINDELIKNLVSFLFYLHEKGVYLRDTKYNNFYYSSASQEKGFKIFDLDGVKIYKKALSKFKRLKDLSTLAMVLEWDKIEKAKKLVFSFYKEIYPLIEEDDFYKFSKLVDKRRKKREENLKKIMN